MLVKIDLQLGGLFDLLFLQLVLLLVLCDGLPSVSGEVFDSDATFLFRFLPPKVGTHCFKPFDTNQFCFFLYIADPLATPIVAGTPSFNLIDGLLPYRPLGR